MKTKKIGLFALPVIAAIMIGSAITPTFAEETVVGKTKDGDGECGIFTPFGNVVGTMVRIDTNNDGGVGKLVCHGEIENTEGKAVVINEETNPEISCTAGGLGITDDWRTTISASGKAVLTCNFPG